MFHFFTLTVFPADHIFSSLEGYTPSKGHSILKQANLRSKNWMHLGHLITQLEEFIFANLPSFYKQIPEEVGEQSSMTRVEMERITYRVGRKFL